MKTLSLSRLKPLLVLAAGELRLGLEGYGTKEGTVAACMLLEAAIEEPKEVDVLAEGPPVTMGRSSKSTVQVVLPGVITIRALSGKAAPPPDPPVDVVTKSPEPPVPVEKLAPVEREEETPLPGADELLKLDEMKLDNGDKDWALQCPSTQPSWEAETPQVPYAPNEDAPKLQEGGKAEADEDSSEDDSIHVAKKQAAADLASKMQEKQKKKEADEKEAESKVTKSEEKEKTRPRVSGAVAKAASRPPQPIEQAHAGMLQGNMNAMGAMGAMGMTGMPMGMDVISSMQMQNMGMGMMGMPCMGYGYDMSGMGMACQPMMMGMQQQTKDAQEAGLTQAAQVAQAQQAQQAQGQADGIRTGLLLPQPNAYKDCHELGILARVVAAFQLEDPRQFASEFERSLKTFTRLQPLEFKALLPCSGLPATPMSEVMPGDGEDLVMPEVIVGASEEITRCVCVRHASSLGCKVTEAKNFGELRQALEVAQRQNWCHALLVFVCERRWEEMIQRLHLHVRPPVLVRCSLYSGLGVCHKKWLPSETRRSFASILAAKSSKREWTVVLKKHPGASLGMDVDMCDASSLIVYVVCETGLVADWNQANPAKMSAWVDLLHKVSSLKHDELGPQVECCPIPLFTPAMDSVLQDPQLLMILVAAAGLPTARAFRAARKVLGKERTTWVWTWVWHAVACLRRVHRLMGQAEAEAEVEEDDELCGAECEAEASAGLARQQWLHRPVTPRELQTARPPLPMSLNDFPSIFPRETFHFPQDRMGGRGKGWERCTAAGAVHLRNVGCDMLRSTATAAVNLIPGIPNSVNNLDGMIRYFWPTDGQDYMQLDSAERFDPMHGTWEVLPRMPTSRAGCAATTADGLIYVTGYLSCSGSQELRHRGPHRWRFSASASGRLGETVLSVFERYDPHIGRWEVLPRVPTARSGCSSVSVKGGIYVLGGKCSNGRVQGVCERFHPTFGRWEKLQPMLSPRSAFAAGVLMEVIYAAGGFNGAVGLSSVECFDPATGFWSETVAMNTPRVGGAAAVTGGCLYVFGGKSSEDLALAGESYDPTRETFGRVERRARAEVGQHGSGRDRRAGAICAHGRAGLHWALVGGSGALLTSGAPALQAAWALGPHAPKALPE
eukprot:g6279.t1